MSGTWVDGALGDATVYVHGGVTPDPATGAILTPVVLSTTYIHESVDKYLAKGYSYSRTANPTVAALEQKINELEGGHSVAFATGMAATIGTLTALMSAGDHAVITNCSYGGTNRACRAMLARFGMEFTFVDMVDPANVTAALRPNTKVVFSETPANPTLTLVDIAAISAICQPRGIVHICDTTFATPYITKGLAHGCDVVIQSLTKYYDGHNINVGGAAVCKTKAMYDQVHLSRNIHGSIMAPHTAFIILQTVKTLPLRIRKQSENAAAVAAMLATHPAVDRVVYPGLASFPQRELADRQHAHGLHGGMLWFEVKGGTEAGRRVMDTVKRPWSLCENLGAVESIITCPAVMTHANMRVEDRLAVGITDGFVRVSCGIEDAADLCRALAESLDALGHGTAPAAAAAAADK